MEDDHQKNGNERKPAGQLKLSNALWPWAISGYAIYQLVSPGHLSMSLIVWNCLILVAGLLMALAVVAGKAMAGPEGAAKGIDNVYRDMYADVKHARRRVDETTIKAYRLDLGFYQRSTEALEELRFKRVADFVDVHLEESVKWSRAVIRCFLSIDGTAMAGVYDIHFYSWQRVMQWVGLLARDLRTVEFESELSDGSFVSTSNATGAEKASEFPGISRQFLSKNSTPAELYAAHCAHLQRVLSEKPGILPYSFKSFDELCAAQDRQNQLKSRHRNSLAFDPAADIARINGKPLTPDQQAMAEEAAEIHARRIREEARQKK